MPAFATYRAFVAAAALAFISVSWPATVEAQDIDCAECHDDVVATSPAHPDAVCGDCHTNVTEEHESRDLEPLTDEDSCGGCHRRPHRESGRSVHGDEARCIDCHGEPHEIHMVADPASAVSPINQIKNCASCHEDPPETIEGFLASVHARGLLASGLAAAPTCTSCHGVHDIREVDDDRAPTSHKNSPEMCGSCHTGLIETWRVDSAHGIGWSEGNEDVPVCTDCHASHEIVDPKLADQRVTSSAVCGGCHDDFLASYRESFHGKANNLGKVTSATCADCHTSHQNLPADHPDSSVHADNLMDTCGACHANITPAFAGIDPHIDPTNPDDNFAVYVVWVFMIGLLIAVFSFFGLHDLLWLQRTLVGAMRGEFTEHPERRGKFVRRFSRMNIRLHLTIVVTFLLLALTGLPLKFHEMNWAQTLMQLLGGVDMAGLIHRIAAIGTFGYAVVHLGHLFVRWAIRRERGLFWGPNSMVPQPVDVLDVMRNFRYFLYLGERPEADRWNYIEKFDYLAVFWGIMIIGLSGLILWFPAVFTAFLPGWVVNAAYIVHSDEALLATGFIFFFHFFHTHLRPESFPMDVVIFTGKMSLERFKEERPLEYQRLVENNELEDYLVEPPTRQELRTAYFWGTIFLVTGISLAIGIVSALLVH